MQLARRQLMACTDTDSVGVRLRIAHPALRVGLPLAAAFVVFIAGASISCASGAAVVERTDRAWWAGEWSPQERYGSFKRSAQYVTARDGTRIATYLYLPGKLEPNDKIPTILVMTPYASEIEFTWLGELLAKNHPARADQIMAERLARYGFATVLMDLPGSGASFGSKPSLFMTGVLSAGPDIVDWIVGRPWSNGKVGATGISAVGMTANWLAMVKHPALKAIAPRFSTFDIYYDVHPGGALADRFVASANRNIRLLDANRFTDMPRSWYLRLLARTQIKGIMPMDADHDRSLLEAAVAEHARNEYFGSDIMAVTDRDDFLPGSSLRATLDTQSPFAHVDAIRASGVAIYALGGWLDGAFGRANISYYNALRAPGSTLTMGPWHHVGREYASPFVPGERKSEFDQVADLARFFEHHLRGADTSSVATEPPVHYFTMGEERWKAAQSWPPPVSEMRRYYFDADHTLSPRSRQAEKSDTYLVDHDATTGIGARFGGRRGGSDDYPDRKEADAALLTYTSAPLATAIEVTGHPLVTLRVSSDRPDGLFIVCLEDVDPHGKVLSVTEGILRGRHRKTSEQTPPYWRAGPYRTFTRADAMPIASGEPMELTFDLFPVSHLFKRGHSVRVALAGGDKDTFLPIPANTPPQAPPTWQVHRGGAHPSFIALPIVAAADTAGRSATH